MVGHDHLIDWHYLLSSFVKLIPLNCLPRPRVGVLHVPQVISSFDNTQDLIEINLKISNCLYQLHADGTVSLDLEFKMQFGNSLLRMTKHRIDSRVSK